MTALTTLVSPLYIGAVPDILFTNAVVAISTANVPTI